MQLITWMTDSKVTNLIKELFAGGVCLDGKLQLSIHCCDANIYLKYKQKYSLKYGKVLCDGHMFT